MVQDGLCIKKLVSRFEGVPTEFALPSDVEQQVSRNGVDYIFRRAVAEAHCLTLASKPITCIQTLDPARSSIQR